MPSSAYSYSPPRIEKAMPPLPSYSSAFHEKQALASRRNKSSTNFSIPIPGVRGRRLRISIPNPTQLGQVLTKHKGRKRRLALICLAVVALIWTFLSLTRRYGSEEKSWPSFQVTEPPTLVFGRDDLQKVWLWEIASGHFPSHRSIPEQIGLRSTPPNPAVPPPPSIHTLPSRFRAPTKWTVTKARGVGPKRLYLDMESQSGSISFPPRPVPGSVSDLDIVMNYCDFSHDKYVRDCLEVLRAGAALDNGIRYRRASLDAWRYIYVEQPVTEPVELSITPERTPEITRPQEYDLDPNVGLSKKRGSEWETPLQLSPPLEYRTAASLPSPCDPDYPRLFHMFWTGPFTDKPYLAILSFLFTQNLGLHHPEPVKRDVCAPQFWLWIKPGPAASAGNPSARREMFEQLSSNPWASPFLHPRFKDVIQFKLWNTTEQLDGVPELKDEWRAMEDTLFNSGGHTIMANKKPAVTETADATNVTASATATATKSQEDDMLNRLGSKSANSYDRMSVILSDMARWILCHRFGGIYLDADNILLRDWEDLWGWRGAFAYRWSRLEKYNTAVLKMNKNSALGSFLFRTALRNGMDFHPMTVSKYMKDAYLEGLLLRLPDALFDPAWLNTEHYQRDRPPHPYFQSFAEFFETPVLDSAAAQISGFDGFFRGAYSYHYHNGWWTPADPSRNWPDLGERFLDGERQLHTEPEESWNKDIDDDKRDLDWASVLKRTFEAYIRGERPNLYGEWFHW